MQDSDCRVRVVAVGVSRNSTVKGAIPGSASAARALFGRRPGWGPGVSRGRRLREPGSCAAIPGHLREDRSHLTGSRLRADPRGWGLNFSGTWLFENRWMPFLRGGYAEDGGSLIQKSISTGVGYQWIPGRDVLGLGFNCRAVRPPSQTNLACGSTRSFRSR